MVTPQTLVMMTENLGNLINPAFHCRYDSARQVALHTNLLAPISPFGCFTMDTIPFDVYEVRHKAQRAIGTLGAKAPKVTSRQVQYLFTIDKF